MAYSCCFSSRRNIDFLDFLQKVFITLIKGLQLYHGKIELLTATGGTNNTRAAFNTEKYAISLILYNNLFG